MPRFLLATTALLSLAAMAMADESSRPVCIAMRPRVEVATRIVRIGDVAALTGGSAALRDRIAIIDLDELAGAGKHHHCSRSQVHLRLKLAGIPEPLFELSGPAETIVIPLRQSLTTQSVAAKAIESLKRLLPQSEAEFEIRVSQPVTAVLPQVAEDDIVEIISVPNVQATGPGRVQMNTSINVNGVRRFALPVYLEVLVVREVAVCARRLERGEVIDAGCIATVRRGLSASDPAARPEFVIGRKLRRSTNPGQVLTAVDVDTTSSTLIRAGQPLNLVVKLGSIDVVAMGEALQPGGLGDIIRVRNTASKKILSGRVTGRKTVEVDAGSQ